MPKKFTLFLVFIILIAIPLIFVMSRHFTADITAGKKITYPAYQVTALYTGEPFHDKSDEEYLTAFVQSCQGIEGFENFSLADVTDSFVKESTFGRCNNVEEFTQELRQDAINEFDQQVFDEVFAYLSDKAVLLSYTEEDIQSYLSIQTEEADVVFNEMLNKEEQEVLKNYLLLMELMKEYSITVTEEEINALIDEMALDPYYGSRDAVLSDSPYEWFSYRISYKKLRTKLGEQVR